jgi:hypothetical protein
MTPASRSPWRRRDGLSGRLDRFDDGRVIDDGGCGS